MAITRQQKEEILKNLTEKLKGAKSVVFSSASGMTMAEQEDLRRTLKSRGIFHKVAKLTLIQKALESLGLPHDRLDFKVSVAVSASHEDEIEAAKLLSEKAKATKKLILVGGIIGHEFYDEKAIVALANLPTKQELRGQLASITRAPLVQFVSVLHRNLYNFVSILTQRSHELK
jgi:large subunit ribosomal protein L10